MNIVQSGTSDRWSSRTTFVLALSESSVGLGNLWRLSYLSGEYGGGAFVITYVLCLFFLAVPVMVAEVVLGRYGGPDTVAAMGHASAGSKLSRGWKLLGILACFTALLLLSLYVVVAGWSLAYVGFMQEGVFSAVRAVEVGAYFEFFLSQTTLQIYWLSVFLLAAVGIVALGVQRGLAMLVWFAVPLMLAMLAFLVKFGFDNGDLDATKGYLFSDCIDGLIGLTAESGGAISIDSGLQTGKACHIEALYALLIMLGTNTAKPINGHCWNFLYR